jgi:hypothetical protein
LTDVAEECELESCFGAVVGEVSRERYERHLKQLLVFDSLEIESGIIRSLCSKALCAKLYYRSTGKNCSTVALYVKLQETLQILRSAGSSKFKRLPSLRQSEPAGNQMPQMPRTNPTQLGKMQHLRTLAIYQLPEMRKTHLLR